MKQYEQEQPEPQPEPQPPWLKPPVIMDDQIHHQVDPGSVQAIQIEGHPEDKYNGRYKKDRMDGGRPVFKHAKRKRYCYYATTDEGSCWLLHNEFTPDYPACASYHSECRDTLPPGGTTTWNHYIQRKRKQGTLTVSLLVRFLMNGYLEPNALITRLIGSSEREVWAREGERLLGLFVAGG